MQNDDPRKSDPLWSLMGLMFRSHPWHGVPIGADSPEFVMAYIEMTPHDTVKMELDKVTGIMMVDRPNLFSSVCPVMYGMIPQTYCAEEVADLCMLRTGKTNIEGDGDPLDVCVLTEKHISHGNILMNTVPIGGLRMIDGNEADDKIIAVLKDDAAYRGYRSVSDCPPSLIDRLRHYFLTYKQSPDSPKREVEIAQIYDREEAHEVIERSQADYRRRFAGIEELLLESLRG